MNLDELLTRAGAVDAPSPEITEHARADVEAAARADISRRALLVRRRRIARIGSAVVGVTAAAAVVGVVALQPSAHAPGEAVKAPVTKAPVSPNFKTVAEVVDAAAAATSSVDPTAAPYWKTVMTGPTYGTIPRLDGTSCIQPGTQTITHWAGNGRPSVQVNTGSDDTLSHPAFAAGTDQVGIAGRTLTWREVNAGTWTDAQLAALVADPGPSGKEGRASSTYYVFKNTLELLQSSPASAAIRKQYWHLLGALDGVRLVGRATDALGRQGWELSYSYPGFGSETAIVDTGSGLLLQSGGSRQDVTAPLYSTLVFAGPADTAPAPQPEVMPAPPVKGSAAWQRMERHLKLWKNWHQVENQPMPYPTCTPADIANMS